ncbi:hypothetical protein [Lignipirellula cremea]|uniref:hypothetical protein n=1 Tax=Lignipirellula cremea TaxID=2528010 RepID=UPI0011A50B2F|nr:hypothetical protein [Lignipirellula cremea]
MFLFLFDSLWAAHLFQDINKACDAMIDDYEEEELPLDVLGAGLRVIAKHRSSTQSPNVSDFLLHLEGLFRKAIKLGFPVYFVL